MPRAVYSTLFLAVHDPPGFFTYSVVSGDTAILHDMTLWVGADHPEVPGNTAVDVTLDDPAIRVWDLNASELIRGIYQWHGREIFHEVLLATITLPVFSLRANGYLLTPT